MNNFNEDKKMESAELNTANIQCGKIFLSLDSFSFKGKILVNCSFCENQFNSFPEYTSHLLLEHYPQMELEDCLNKRNCQNIKVEKNSESRKNNTNTSTNEFMKFLQMDLNKTDNDNFLDIQKLIESSDEWPISEDPTKLEVQNESVTEEANIKFDKNKKCPHCDRSFFLSSSLQHHLERHRNTGDSIGGLYKCNLCKSEFDLKFSLMLHVGEHRLNKNVQNRDKAVGAENKRTTTTLPKKQNFIKKTFSKISILNQNTMVTRAASTKSNKTAEQSVNVDNTSKPVNDSDHDDVFEISNATVDPDELHCEICNKKFYGQSRFNAHMNRHKPCEFKCTTCFKEFKTAGELRTHTRFHTGERPYLCANCGETFATVSKLINHTRRHHTFERTKQCPICKKKFYAAGELKIHLQSTHSNERPYQCKICPATFNRPFSLRTHMKSHENKREYKCNLCPASFNQKCNLTAHKKKAHCLLTDDDKRV